MTPNAIPALPRAGGRLTLGLVILAVSTSATSVRINEVADKGTKHACGGDDWIELYLPATASSSVDLGAGYVLHDDNGPDDKKALVFADEEIDPLEPGDYLLLCQGKGSGKFRFGIGNKDTVTLRDAKGSVLSTTGKLPGKGEKDITYAYDSITEAYTYTLKPTPGKANNIVPRTVKEMRRRLVMQNAKGTAFFNMGDDGKEVEGSLPEIVDLHIQMDPDVRTDMHDVARSHSTWRPWLSAKVTDGDGRLILELPSPGRIRPKGQSTVYIYTCMDESVPYGIDFGKGAEGSDPTQTLFGIERAYLRLPLLDTSYTREWAAHRLLARFGLPHLRTRSVRVHINGEPQGLYEMIEAPDQDYVYQRSFPDFDPKSYGLYKYKLGVGDCGRYSDDQIAQAEARIDETSTPPYAFERGDHRPMTPVLKDIEACIAAFYENVVIPKIDDAALAYVRSGEGECGEFLVETDLISRKLGSKKLDKKMEAFVDDNLGTFTCDAGCTNSNLLQQVDITSFLRNLAADVGMLRFDGPLLNLSFQNFYLAYNDGLWSMVQWDHNDAFTASGGNCFQCMGQATIDWSILRPTCHWAEENRIYGPLLSDPDLRGQYVEYLRELVNDIMANDDFLDQIQAHLIAIKDDVDEDLFGVPFSRELAVSDSDESTWGIAPVPYPPLLGFLYAKTASIKEQLDAIDAGTFPRNLDDIAPEEVCVDWQLDGPSTPTIAAVE